MSWAEIILGSSLYTHLKNKLRLAVTSSAKVSFPNPFFISPAPLSPLEILASKDTWVSLGPELKLSVDVYLNGLLCGGDRTAASVFNGIGDVLAKADLWSDLRLVVSRRNSGTTLDEQDSGRLVFAIQPELVTSNDLKERTPNYNDDASIQPPGGVPTAVLHELNISFRFHATERGSKPGSYPNLRPTYAAFDDLLLAFDYSQPEEPDSLDIPGPLRSGVPFSDNSQCKFSSFYLPNGGCQEFSENDSPFSSQQSQLSCSTSQSCQSRVDIGRTDKNGDIEPLIMMIDSGFRGIICDKPLRTAAGIKMQVEEPTTKLADVAPACFSPRYLSVISPRTRYIPMIAKTISSMLEKTNSMKLKEKPKLLNEAFRARCVNAGGGGIVDPLDTRSNIKCLLWMSLQRKAFDPGAARRLKRIGPSVTSKEQDNPQHGTEEEPALPFSTNVPGSDSMIDIPEGIYPINPQGDVYQPIDDDPYEDLLFSELGLYEDDDEYHNTGMLDRPDANIHPQPEEDIDDYIFNYINSSPRAFNHPEEIPPLYTPSNPHTTRTSDTDDEILDPQTSPPKTPCDNNSPMLPMSPASSQIIYLDGTSSPPLSATADLIYTDVPTGSDIPPSSPPDTIGSMDIDQDDGYGEDDMLLC